MGHELFIEIGVEELPARFCRPAMKELESRLTAELAAAKLTHGAILTFATPRRLVLQAADLIARQADRTETRTGPPASAAYDAGGNPTKAAIGFAKGQGVDVTELIRIPTEKGEYLGLTKTIVGRDAAEVLAEILPEVISGLTFPKAMKWGSLDFRFARPLHRLVALFDGRTIPFEIAGITTGNATVGHRFLSPGAFEVNGLADYLEKTKQAGLEIEHEKRKAQIRKKISELAASIGGEPLADEALLEEVTFITESPYPILGRFEESYLKLPREVIITPMRTHQKYFPIQDKDQNLLACFIAVSDIKPKDPAMVASGYAKVLRARLEDARFFFEEDQKTSLDQFSEKLDGMIFQKKLGSYADKMERVGRIADYLAEQVSAETKLVSRAVKLMKADLLCLTVGEFPELQGVMGGHYARLTGEPDEVVQAVAEHYQPRFSGDKLPQTATGAVCAVADRLDSIAGCFGVGLIPTGSGDPYALRRAALGVVAICQRFDWRVSLNDLIGRSISAVADKFTRPGKETHALILKFFRDRLYNLYTGEGFEHEVVQSVLSAGFDDLCDLEDRLKALAELRRQADFEPLAVSFKRVANILEDSQSAQVDPKLFEQDEENALNLAFNEVHKKLSQRLNQHDYRGALDDLATLKEPIDNFFDHVMVNCEDQKIRSNRMAQLSAIAAAFSGIADFRQFAV